MGMSPHAPPAAPPVTEPELRALIRRVLRGLCQFTGLVSALFAAVGATGAAQILADDIPAGRITAITGHSKLGPHVHLDTGRDATFPTWAIHRRDEPVRLAAGDVIEKRADSFVYLLNGRPLTDTSAAVGDLLLPLHLRIFLGAYLLFGTWFVLAHGRTPQGDAIWPDDAPKRPRRPRTRAGLLAMLLVNWLLLFVLILAASAASARA